MAGDSHGGTSQNTGVTTPSLREAARLLLMSASTSLIEPDDPTLRQILDAAVDLPAESRPAFLDQACGGDSGLRERLESLLLALDQVEGFLDSPTLEDTRQTMSASPAREAPGSWIGPYQLLQKIGEGGMGVVYMAEQQRPVVRRVALKVIKLGMDTHEVIARFEAERQALALMDHPNIAKVFEAGSTESGRPYFVMELVKGIPITEYCDTNSLSTRQRLELFLPVCRAVQHAHQKGIIHRDLKPSNILVTVNDGEAVPKVIDFGIAKATQGRLTDRTLFTQFEQMIGTPLYMSPEQAQTGLDVDTRSDVYALGVVLYELLTGHTPIDSSTMAKAGMAEVRRLILEVDPPVPSARLRTLSDVELAGIAKRRHTDATKLPRALCGDVDWIVMKCLEKDRKRRYETANGLATDLQRHLRNQAVAARPPTTAYLLSRLVRRHRLAFGAGAAVAVSLVIGIAASAWQAVRATTALDELRATAPAFAEQARGLAAREQFDAAVEKLDYALKLRPGAAEYLVAKADLLQCQLKLAEAAATYRQALREKPGLARAKSSATLCEELLAAPLSQNGRLTRESLAKLHLAMQKQQRPAAELMPVARLLGEEKKLVVGYWLARLKDLPVSPERPLKERLAVRDDGRLALDLSDTKVIDLSPLSGAPLAELDLSRCEDLADLSALRGLDLLELDVSGTSVADLSPLRDMHSLASLDVAASNASDLTPLAALRLTRLNLSGARIFDISPLRGMKLRSISLWRTRVDDLSPLAGMPLASFDGTGIPAADYGALAGAPLVTCRLTDSPARDLSFLRGSPVRVLNLSGCNELRGYSVLAGLGALEVLALPQSYRSLPDAELTAIEKLRAHPKLKNIETAYSSGWGRVTTTPSKESFWQDWDREQRFLPALRKSVISFSLSKLPSGTYSLIVQQQPPLRDLSFLKGAPISELALPGCQVTDLTPLRDLPLETLNVPANPITDLSPLRGMRLKTLYLTGTKVSDLSPLTGLPLRGLYLGDCQSVTDVAPLALIRTLESVTVPVQAANIEALRELPNLRWLSFQLTASDPWIADTTAEEFWKLYRANGWISRLRDSGFKANRLKRLGDGTWEVDLAGSGISDLSVLKGAPISRLNVDDTPVGDLTPLAGMDLKQLSARSTRVRDLAFLRASECRSTLEALWLLNTRVVDLSPLSECTSLKTLDLSYTATASLEPLRGLKLKLLYLNNSKVHDLSPLAGMPLEFLYLSGTPAADLAPLAEMPLKTLVLEDSAAADVEPLARCPTLEALIVPAGARNLALLRALPRLQRISYRHKENDWAEPSLSAAEFWKAFGWEARLHESGLKIGRLSRLPDGTWDVSLDGSGVGDLTILKQAPVSRLSLMDTPVSDLGPLRGMALKRLALYKTRVTDLTPLAGMRLEHLNLSDTRVRDLSVLRGMPLTDLQLDGCTELTDVSPLAGCRGLRALTLPANATGFEFLREFPALERVGFRQDPENGYRPDKSAAEFWDEVGQEWVKALRKAGVRYAAARDAAGAWSVTVRSKEFRDCSVFEGAAVRELVLEGTGVADLRPLGGLALTKLDVRQTPVSDLATLRAPRLCGSLREVYLWSTPVKDFSPLASCANLEVLDASGTALIDLSVLRGRRLRIIHLEDTRVTDISVLAGMPLTRVVLRGTGVTDLSPLHGCATLTQLVLPAGARDVGALRALPALVALSYETKPGGAPKQTAAEFWKQYDAAGALPALKGSGRAGG